VTNLGLICLPFAGAGASLYREWRHHSGGRLRLIPVQLPGREERFADAPLETMPEVVDEVVGNVLDTATKGPFALFGHSFGALVAYETAQALVARQLPRPRLLVVSGIASPWEPRTPLGVGSLSTADFIERLGQLIGYRHAALTIPDLLEVVLPALRADMTIADEYTPSSRTALPVPIVVLRGSHDKVVSAEDVAAWSHVGGAGVDFIEISGPHMYFSDDPSPLITVLERIFVDFA
jgi:surfactin synthase thioesterase subunit